MTTVGVLCARVRVEEKQLLAALAEAGVVPAPLAPAAVPLPVGPLPPCPPGAGFTLGAPAADLIVDRCQDRAVAAVILRVARTLGVPTIDAGIAAAGDRLAVAAALAAAGIPQPDTRLACNAEAAVAALAEFGYPCTLVPLRLGAATVTLPDPDTAEAVIEHRSVLGSAAEALSLIQAGAVDQGERWSVVVVDGRAVGAAPTADGTPIPAAGLSLAEEAARVLGAGLIGVTVARVGGTLGVWDVEPVPDYRHAAPVGRVSVAAAVAAGALSRHGSSPAARALPAEPDPLRAGSIVINDATWATSGQREVRNGVPLSA